jgi:dTDP-4-dehydrorhamnose reductase
MAGRIFESRRTLILGTGYVAGAYMRSLNFLGLCPMALSRAWVDYTDPDELKSFLGIFRPQLLINAAGYTGVTIDDCERNKDACYLANVALPRNAGLICKELGISVIHISSGCIFTGPGPFKEDDKPNNLTPFYTRCKADAERELADTRAMAWVFRIRMPFNHLMHPRNWLTKLSTYDRILDGLNSVTFLDEFAMRSYQLVQKAEPGIYHAAYSTPVSTAAVARMLFDAGLRKKHVASFDPRDFISAGHVPRSEAILDCSKFESAYGTTFGDPLAALRWCIDKMQGAGAASAS